MQRKERDRPKKTSLVFYLPSRYAVYASEMLIYVFSLPENITAKALHERRSEKHIPKCESAGGVSKPLKILRENKNAKAVREHLSPAITDFRSFSDFGKPEELAKRRS